MTIDNAGKYVLDDDGHFVLDPTTGHFLVFDEIGECPQCCGYGCAGVNPRTLRVGLWGENWKHPSYSDQVLRDNSWFEWVDCVWNSSGGYYQTESAIVPPSNPVSWRYGYNGGTPRYYPGSGFRVRVGCSSIATNVADPPNPNYDLYGLPVTFRNAAGTSPLTNQPGANFYWKSTNLPPFPSGYQSGTYNISTNVGARPSSIYVPTIGVGNTSVGGLPFFWTLKVTSLDSGIYRTYNPVGARVVDSSMSPGVDDFYVNIDDVTTIDSFLEYWMEQIGGWLNANEGGYSGTTIAFPLEFTWIDSPAVFRVSCYTSSAGKVKFHLASFVIDSVDDNGFGWSINTSFTDLASPEITLSSSMSWDVPVKFTSSGSGDIEIDTVRFELTA